eukprot:m.51941 g.51941  ORF g.51941 m.51941 type:complete len:82 (-) comp12662_c0_seq1:49-294(-)
MPQLKDIWGAVSVTNNGMLSNIDMPVFHSLNGSFTICNNPSLESIPSAFYHLTGWTSCTLCMACDYCPAAIACPSSQPFLP